MTVPTGTALLIPYTHAENEIFSIHFRTEGVMIFRVFLGLGPGYRYPFCQLLGIGKGGKTMRPARQSDKMLVFKKVMRAYRSGAPPLAYATFFHWVFVCPGQSE